MRESGLGAGGPGQRRPRRGQCLAFKERGTGRVTVAHSIFKSLELKYAENLKTWWFPSINFPFSKRSSECWPHPHCKETVWDLKSTANPPAPGSRGSRGTGQAGFGVGAGTTALGRPHSPPMGAQLAFTPQSTAPLASPCSSSQPKPGRMKSLFPIPVRP